MPSLKMNPHRISPVCRQSNMQEVKSQPIGKYSRFLEAASRGLLGKVLSFVGGGLSLLSQLLGHGRAGGIGQGASAICCGLSTAGIRAGFGSGSGSLAGIGGTE